MLQVGVAVGESQSLVRVCDVLGTPTPDQFAKGQSCCACYATSMLELRVIVCPHRRVKYNS